MSENINHRQIQWFPGHMARTLRLISENRKNVDVVLQLLDARTGEPSPNSVVSFHVPPICGTLVRAD